MDYPAAHSMDTMWFAVDADGHVAAFDTGEGGGVPELAFVEDPYELAGLIRELPEGEAKLDPIGHALGATRQHADLTSSEQPMNVRAFISDLEPVKDLVAQLSGTVLAAATGVAVELVVGDRAAFDQLHERGACQGCQLYWGADESDLAAHGVFRYDCGDAIATPYVRLAVPGKPLAIGDAPAQVRAHAIRFAGRFADTPQLQPAEHWKSQGWSAGWVATDGKTVRPFPGRETDFAKELDDYREHTDGCVVVTEVLELPDGELESAGVEPAKPPDARVVDSGSKKPWWKFW